jgi:hypothetical protein
VWEGREARQEREEKGEEKEEEEMIKSRVIRGLLVLYFI